MLGSECSVNRGLVAKNSAEIHTLTAEVTSAGSLVLLWLVVLCLAARRRRYEDYQRGAPPHISFQSAHCLVKFVSVFQAVVKGV